MIPLGAYPQLRLCPHVGNAPTKKRIRITSTIVPNVIFYLLCFLTYFINFFCSFSYYLIFCPIKFFTTNLRCMRVSNISPSCFKLTFYRVNIILYIEQYPLNYSSYSLQFRYNLLSSLGGNERRISTIFLDDYTFLRPIDSLHLCSLPCR